MSQNPYAASLLLLMYAIPLSATENGPAWQVVEIGRVGDVIIRLRVLSSATMADEDWLAIEFHNIGTAPVQVRRARYRIKCETFTLDEGRPRGSQGLASGNAYDLFPKAWETTPVADILIQEGVYRVVQHPSRYSSTLLGLPSREGILVKGVLHLSFELQGGVTLELPVEGKPFEFKWLYPDEDGFARMRGRLSKLLETPESGSHHVHSYILGALLKIPSVAEDIKPQTVLSAIDRRTTEFDGRSVLLAHLVTNYGQSKAIKNYYLDSLQKHHMLACRDLQRAPSLWNPSFVEPLVAIYEQNARSSALDVLAQHHEDWAGHQSFARRLSTVVIRRFGWVLKKQPQDLMKNGDDTPTLNIWSMHAMDLAHTHDMNVLRLLRPFLDCKAQVLDPRFLAFRFPAEIPPPYRACDVALHAILTILDGGVEQAYREARWPRRSIVTPDPSAIKRDEMIAVLKKRLAELDTTP